MKRELLLLSFVTLPALSLQAAEIGKIKTMSGQVSVVRNGATLNPSIGSPVFEKDVLRTGSNGSTGVTFDDNSLISLGPNSVFALEKFTFDPTTHKGVFETRLKKGTLAGVSGKINKETPEAMKIRTPAAILGLRGTEFRAHVEGEEQ